MSRLKCTKDATILAGAPKAIGENPEKQAKIHD
jgi:hypothetical protein